MRDPAAAALLVWFLCGPALAGVAVLHDVDGDGFPDTAEAGDWDGDGELEMEDVQAAVDALSDRGVKVLRLEPGRYLAPASTPHRWGLVELPSNLILEGNGPETILEGMTGNCEVTSPCPNQVAVLANDGIEGPGNYHIVVRDLQIDGGAPEEYSGTWTPTRPGVRFTTARDVLVERVLVHHVYHTCLYASDSRDVSFVDNEAHDCGGFDRTDPEAPGYPAVYVYANWRPVQRIRITGNRLYRTGNTAVSFRKAPTSPLPLLEDVFLAGNEIHDTVGVRTVARCFNTSGTNTMSVVGNVCRNTAGVQVTPGDAYFEKGVSVNAATRLLVEGLLVDGTRNGNPLEVGRNVDDALIRNVRVVGSDPGAPCVTIFDPIRSVTFDGLTLEECGGPAVRTSLLPGTPVRGSGFRLGEALRFRDVRALRSTPWPGGTYPAMQFLDDTAGIRIDGLRVSGFFPVPYAFEGDAYGATIRVCPYDDPSGPCTIERY